MKSIPISLLLTSLEQQVDSQLTYAIRELQNLPVEILLKPASNGGWSIAQCVEHLNSYGSFYLPEIQKALARNSDKYAPETFKSSRLGQYFTKLMQPGSNKKMKAFKNHIPAENLDAPAVIATFIEQQETLLQYLQKARHADLRSKLPLSISWLIKLQLGDVFRFLIAHNERHLQQTGRNFIPNAAE